MEKAGLKGFFYLELLLTTFLAGLILALLFGWQQTYFKAQKKTADYYSQKEQTVNKIEQDHGATLYTTGNMTVKKSDGIVYLTF